MTGKHPRMHEGYLEQGLLVKDAKKLRLHYYTARSWPVLVLYQTQESDLPPGPGECPADRPGLPLHRHGVS